MLRAPRATFGACFAALLLVAPSLALATSFDGLEITAGLLDDESMQMVITDAMIQQRIDAGELVVSQEGDEVIVSGSTFFQMPAWEFELEEIRFDPDPFVSISGGLANLMGSPQDFFVTTVIPIVPVLPSSLVGGSTTLTYGDSDFSATGGLTNTVGGLSGYAGLIDSMEVLSLLNAFSLTPAFAGETKAVSEANGLPGPTIPGPAANTTIGITNRFNLSGGDRATWNSTFIVEPVPEPGTALLVGLGLVGLGAIRRRG